MTKKSEYRGDAPLAIMTPGAGEIVPYGLAISGTAPMTRTEERMFEEKRRQQLAIEHQKDKTKQGVRCVGEIHQQAAAVFAQDMSHRAAINEAAQGKPYAALVQEFNDYAANLEAQHLYRIIETGTYNIGNLVSQTTYMADVPEPEKKLNRLQKLLRG